MENVKQWYKSKTIWASLVTVVLGVLASFGVGDYSEHSTSITDNIMSIVMTVSGVLALFGRIKADSKIGGDK